ncbi:unnamed protein product [Closterium sp. Yama58-4]|nr:unnamed protein product [Closterium sp. Yama58-4]
MVSCLRICLGGYRSLGFAFCSQLHNGIPTKKGGWMDCLETNRVRVQCQEGGRKEAMRELRAAGWNGGSAKDRREDVGWKKNSVNMNGNNRSSSSSIL